MKEFDLAILGTIGIKLLFSIVCGAIIGYEREKSHAPAGFKTQILICTGSALYAALAILLQPNDSTSLSRIVGQVITGVGFLGAGSILHQKDNHVIGLTTAAWIWVASALGILCGLDYGSAAVLITLALVVVIFVAGKFERTYINRVQPEVKDKVN
ncbi:MAG: MgtC/SapB family protein [Pseudobdellovibrio sp.]